MTKKYKFTDTFLNWKGRILQRIKRLSDGKLGGWIEKEENLSHRGNCWIGNEAKVFDNAIVNGNAQVYGHIQICGRVQIGGDVEINGNYENINNEGDFYLYINTQQDFDENYKILKEKIIKSEKKISSKRIEFINHIKINNINRIQKVMKRMLEEEHKELY
jgi:hypothetical protein